MPMSRGWKQATSWSNEDSTAAEAPHSVRRQSAHIPSSNVQQALWTASKRLGSCYRFLKLDLDMLAATDEAEDVLAAMACALQKLGAALLPKFGASPIDPVLAARSDVQELVGLLGALTCRKQAVFEAPQESMRSNGLQDPLQSTDPWSREQSVGNQGTEKGKTVKSSGLSGKGIYVPPPLIETVEKIVEVPTVIEKVQTVEKIVEVPTVVEKIIEVPQVQVVEKVVEKVIEIDKIVEVPMVQTVEKERIVEKVIEVPCKSMSTVSVECQAKDTLIRAETDLSAPESEHRAEMERRIAAHKARYPGGQLPNELCTFSEFMRRKQISLTNAQTEKLRCLWCGQLPWLQ